MKTIIIIGAGFAGLNAAKILGKNKNIKITVVDKSHNHLFQPLLYQVATATLNSNEISVPIRNLLAAYPNIEVRKGEVKKIDINNKIIHTADYSLNYDYLIVACGSNYNYFGHSEWESFAPGLKTSEQANEIKRKILLAFEKAENTSDPVIIEKLLTFAVVGGGPTGVELAGALAEISGKILKKYFNHIEPDKTKILLIEAGPRILNNFPPHLGEIANKNLHDLGVTVKKSSKVLDVSKDGIKLQNDFIATETVIWAAGVVPSLLNKNLQEMGVELDSGGRVIVEKDLSLKKFPEVFVLGDQAHFDRGNNQILPGLAAVAMQEGKWAAKNILRDLEFKPRENFVYKDRGQMATIGRNKAIVQYKNLEFSGFMAWLTWIIVHIYYLIGFKNRIKTIFLWSWNYFSFKRAVLLIVRKDWQSSHKPAKQPQLPA